MIGYIYVITNNINGRQYVGQTIQTIEKRYENHIRDAKGGYTNMYIHKAIRKYGEENFSINQLEMVEYELYEDLIEQLNILEKFYIKKCNTLNPNGYNLTQGGERRSEDAKVAVDEYDLNGSFIQTHESLLMAALSVGSKHNGAIAKCCNGISKFAFQRIWRYHSDSLDKYELPDVTIANREYKMAPVDKYSIKGEFICSYNSMALAEIDLGLDFGVSHISNCCKGKQYTACGYVWRYKGEPFGKYIEKDKRFRKCAVYDLNDILIGTFDSILDACNHLGIDYKKASSHISQCCQGKRKTTNGYKWKYV